MARATFDEQEEIIDNARKGINYDTKEFTLELIHSKFNRDIEDSNQKEIMIPFYQRNFIWDPDRQSKFIESLLLGLPVPSMLFAETENGVLEVIDGSQRIGTINNFLNNTLVLRGLEKLNGLNGLKFNDFNSSRKRKIRNTTIRSIVIFDLEKDTLDISLELFERVNTGGVNLTKAEIIKGSQNGKFTQFVFEMAELTTTFNTLSKFSKDDILRGFREEFLIKYFAFVNNMEFSESINDYLDNFIDISNTNFENESFRDKMLVNLKEMLTFLDENRLITDISINKKNRLLAAYIGTTLALKENPNITPKQIFTDEFFENAKSSGFNKLKENVELVKNILLAD